MKTKYEFTNSISNKKSYTVTPETGYTIDLDNSNLSKGLIVTKEVGPDYKYNSEEHYNDSYCSTRIYSITSKVHDATIALSKLMSLRNKLNGWWCPDWNDYSADKYVITLVEQDWITQEATAFPNVLAFKTKEIAQGVLDNNKELLEDYKGLFV